MSDHIRFVGPLDRVLFLKSLPFTQGLPTAKLGVDEVMKPAEVDHDNGPRLTYSLGMEKHEFGRLMEGTVAEHTFELANTGKEELIIKQVKPTCGCTVAQVYSENDSGEMELYTFGEAIVYAGGLYGSMGETVAVPAPAALAALALGAVGVRRGRKRVA